MCMNVLPICVTMYHVHVCCQQRPEEGIGVTETCEPLMWVLGKNLGPPKSRLCSEIWAPLSV